MRISFKFILGIIISIITISLVTSCQPCSADSALLTWDANTEASLTGYKVYFKSDLAALPFNGTSTVDTSPTDVLKQTNITLSDFDSDHTDCFSITDYDISGIENEYSQIATIPEAIPPTFSLTSTDNIGNVSGSISVIAYVSNNIAVVKAPNGIINSKEVFPILLVLSRNSVISRNQESEVIGGLASNYFCREIAIALTTCNRPGLHNT